MLLKGYQCELLSQCYPIYMCDDRWLVKHCAPLSMHSSQVMSPIVMLFSMMSQTAFSDDCSQSCMLLHGWLLASDVSTTSHQHFETHCTGCRYHSASPSISRSFFWLFSWPMSEVLQRRVHSCAHCGRTFASKISRPRWPRRPACAVSFRLSQFSSSGPTIWKDLPVDFQSTDITREQFKRSLKSWLFECAYGRRSVWETVQSEGAPKKWTYLLTYLDELLSLQGYPRELLPLTVAGIPSMHICLDFIPELIAQPHLDKQVWTRVLLTIVFQVPSQHRKTLILKNNASTWGTSIVLAHIITYS